MSRELYRTNTPPLRGEIVAHDGRLYRVTNVKRFHTTPDATCVVYGVGLRAEDQAADVREAFLDFAYAFFVALGIPRLTGRLGMQPRAWVRERQERDLRSVR